jgi:hypothetical protein
MLVGLWILTSIKERECNPAVFFTRWAFIKKAQPLRY